MPGKSEKSSPAELKAAPSIIRSIGFGIMVIIWWILSIEIPHHDIWYVKNQNYIQMDLSPITEWVYGVADLWIKFRWLGVLAVIVIIPLHLWLWKRRMNYDPYGKWLFKAGFMVFYVITYGFFLLMFLGTELSIRFNNLPEL